MIHGKKISYTCESSSIFPFWHWNATVILNQADIVDQSSICTLLYCCIYRIYQIWSQNIHRCPKVVFTCLSEFWRAMFLLELISLIRHYGVHTVPRITDNISSAIHCFWLKANAFQNRHHGHWTNGILSVTNITSRRLMGENYKDSTMSSKRVSEPGREQ